MKRKLTVAASATLFVLGMLLVTRDTEHVTVGRVVVAALCCLGGLVAFGLTFRDE